ncbi:uncharacterized protein LOC106766179 [Vigna radiata var. radiata]|uniref:Uncharacterized protein LOC106766179 n=1 Tax=Vigna radiata var. radiata TaxID=3916 RepID=A0A1S3UKF2_VIGRR|nr:uncharacterized protein LOC106766179 [Vigna radiata var. radiata]
MEPKKVEEALSDENWIVAMQEKLNQFTKNNVWELMPRKPELQVIGTKWVFQNKMDDSGEIIKNKVEQPPGFEDFEYPDHVYKLKKALYGLKQAPRSWYERLSEFLMKKGYSRGKFSKVMQEEFEMSMMGELTYFLGLQVKQTTDGIFIHQSKYCNYLLKRFKMTKCKDVATPMATNCYLDLDEAGKNVDQRMFRGMIGSLLYLTASRPDIMHSVCLCARFQSAPKESHLIVVKRILKYLKGTKNHGLWYPNGSNLFLNGYSDFDFGGCKLDRKSTSGTCHLLGSSLISWNSEKQACAALSTT